MQYRNKPIFILAIIILIPFVSLDHANGIAKTKRNSIHLTQKDKAQIIESVLRQELSKKDFPKSETYLFLKDPILPSELVPAIYKDKIEMIEPEEVRAREDRKERVLILFFNEFKARRGKVIVDFGRSYSAPNYRNEEGTIYEYRKVGGRWRGRSTKGRVSIFEEG